LPQAPRISLEPQVYAPPQSHGAAALADAHGSTRAPPPPPNPGEKRLPSVGELPLMQLYDPFFESGILAGLGAAAGGAPAATGAASNYTSAASSAASSVASSPASSRPTSAGPAAAAAADATQRFTVTVASLAFEAGPARSLRSFRSST
jgi:hypothetical protein